MVATRTSSGGLQPELHGQGIGDSSCAALEAGADGTSAVDGRRRHPSGILVDQRNNVHTAHCLEFLSQGEVDALLVVSRGHLDFLLNCYLDAVDAVEQYENEHMLEADCSSGSGSESPTG